MKKLLLIPFFLFAPVFGGPQDSGLHLFGPQNKGPSPSDKLERFNLMGEMIGEFNCNTGEFLVTGGNNVGDKIPIGKWISKQYLIENSEEWRDSAGNLIASAKVMGEMEYSFVEADVVCD